MNPERRRDGYIPTVHRSVYLSNCPLLLFCVGRSTVVVRSNVAQVFVIASVNFRVMPRRGPSDRFSEQQRHALEADLRAYILQMQESSTPLWCFGVYGNTSALSATSGASDAEQRVEDVERRAVEDQERTVRLQRSSGRRARVGSAHATAEDGQTRCKALGGEAPREDEESTVSLQRSSGRQARVGCAHTATEDGQTRCKALGGEAPRELQDMGNCPEDAAIAVCPRWIKKHCETHGAEQEHGSPSGLRVCVERALTGPTVRTTLRVVEPSSRKRTFWCEVRLKESKEHERIRVAAAVKSGTVVSKTAAQQLKDELVADSCA